MECDASYVVSCIWCQSHDVEFATDLGQLGCDSMVITCLSIGDVL